MYLELIKNLSNYLEEEFKINHLNYNNIILEQCPDYIKDYDIMINCFKLTKYLNSTNELIANSIYKYLKNNKYINKIEKNKSFINFNLKPDFLFKIALDVYIRHIISDLPIISKSKKIMIEYSAPNTNKPMHLGHIRNNIIGMSLVNILKKVGHTVYAVNLINDRGIHICKSMIAYQLYGNNETPNSSSKKGDHFVGDFYIKFTKELNKQISFLKKNNPGLNDKNENELFIKTNIGKAVKNMLIKWETGDKETIILWKKMNKWVMDGFYKTYNRMGTIFDKFYFESDIYKLGKKIIKDNLKNEIFKKENEAIYVDLTKKALGKKILLRSDGTSMYITQDIGLTIKKNKDFNIDKQIWIVGNEQIHHFNILFTIMNIINKENKCEYYHLPHGMIELPDGKMKSREGKIVDADQIFDQLFHLTKQYIIQKDNIKKKNNIDEYAEIISMGAIKFMLLKYNSKTDIIFNPEATIKLEGDTGPYIQYACVRINSIIKKMTINSRDLLDHLQSYQNNINWNKLKTRIEKKIAILIIKYPITLKNAANKLDCSILTTFLLNLSKYFNYFYKKCPIITAKTKELQQTRLALCFMVRETIYDICKILTIKIPEFM